MHNIADQREFIKISQAVGIGFVIIGAVGFFIKLSTCLSTFVTSLLADKLTCVFGSSHSCQSNISGRGMKESAKRSKKYRIRQGSSVDMALIQQGV